MDREVTDSTALGRIEAVFHRLTTVERTIADFFLKNQSETNLSSKNVSGLLYVSEASLSRFAKKCGYKGYREFLFHYESERSMRSVHLDEQTKRVLATYQQLLDQTHLLVNEAQLHQVAELLTQSPRVYIYGMGSSGIAAMEFKLRFMRLGLDVEAVTDAHIMRITSAIVRQDSLVIGISLSGKTREILSALSLAKERGAATLLITSHESPDIRRYCHHVLRIAGIKNLEGGNLISPQFPILVFVDIFYAYYLKTDFYHKLALHNSTLTALDVKE